MIKDTDLQIADAAGANTPAGENAVLSNETLESMKSEEEEDEPESVEPPLRKGLQETDFVTAASTFEELNLTEILQAAIAKKGWKEPTPVQQMCLPFALRGRNVAGFAQTGTGKTGVFLLTAAQKITQLSAEERQRPTGKASHPLTVILAPTRELAIQIHDDAETLLGPAGVSSIAVFGGADWEKQARQLESGVEVIIATPGRLKDFFQKNLVVLDRCSLFVCDECDRMFDMGFILDVEFFLEKMADDAQKLLFSATTNEEVKELVFKYLDNPEYIAVNPESLTPEKIEQHAVICSAIHKLKTLMGLIQDTKPNRALIFTNTKASAEWLHFKLTNNGIPADVITGDLPQRKRIQLIDRIKKGEVHVLIATDVASRGLHIAGVTHVFNFDLPDDAANYVHRIGRTARGGEKGTSYTLVCEDYGHNLLPIQELLGELAPRAVWHDAKYLEIEDKAGSPAPRVRPRTNDPRRGGSGRDGQGQRFGRDNRDGRGRGEGPRQDDGARGSHRRDRQNGDSPRHGNRNSGGQGYKLQDGQLQRRHDQNSHRHGGRGHGSRGHDDQNGRHQRRNRGGDRGQRPLVDTVAAAKQAATPATQTPAPKTIGGIFKRLFRVFFGGKD